MNYYVIIVAGGSGSRMDSGIPKQFLSIKNKPVIVHTIEKFYSWNESIKPIVVIHPDYESHWENLKVKYFPKKDISHTFGGKERFHSVKNGLKLISEEGLVAIHDAARPLVSEDVISNCFLVAQECCSAVPVIAVFETLRKKTGEDDSEMVNRADYVLVQTPQVFEKEIIQKAYNQAYDAKFTDDASVVEAMNEHIHLVDGNKENIKITVQADLAIAEALL